MMLFDVRAWLDFDALGMLQQLGVVPPPGAAQFSRQLPVD
jgi:hypothetical protein